MNAFRVYPTKYVKGRAVLCFVPLWLRYPFDMDSCTNSPERVNLVHIYDIYILRFKIDYKIMNIVSFSFQEICSGIRRTFFEWTQAKS